MCSSDLMIEALGRLCRLEDVPEVHLVLVGTGRAEEAYRTLARELGLGDRVHFTGFCEHPHIYQNVFDINLNASRGTETSCLATSECMSLGIPTIASDFGGNPEMIRHGENGLLFSRESVCELSQAIASLLRDPLLYLRLCDGALRVYEDRFSLSHMANAYRTLYRQLLTEGALR